MRGRSFDGGGNLFNLSAYDMNGEKQISVSIPNTWGLGISTGR
jgi:hypothetical protein